MKGEKGGPGLGGIPGENFTVTGIVEEVYYTLFQDIYAARFFFLNYLIFINTPEFKWP